MRVATQIQLGLKKQLIHVLNDDNCSVLTVESCLQNLGTSLCALYKTHNCNSMIIGGPSNMTHKIAGDVTKVSQTYANYPPLYIEII